MEVARKFLEIRASQKFLAGRAGRVSKVELKVIRESSQLADKVASLENSLWWKEEPFLPRPILSVHIRQGDKGKEMFLFSMVSYMWLAERLRKHVPNLKNVWLSTEMEVRASYTIFFLLENLGNFSSFKRFSHFLYNCRVFGVSRNSSLYCFI